VPGGLAGWLAGCWRLGPSGMLIMITDRDHSLEKKYQLIIVFSVIMITALNQ
jgi:hypothetical protein